MNTTVEALRALYVALGGTASDVANLVIIPDVINAIATLCEDREALPAVTAADNGKVLKVADGVWTVGTDATTA